MLRTSLGLKNVQHYSVDDTIWMNVQPVKTYFFNTEMCEFQIFAHEESEVINDVLEQLRKKQSEEGEIDTTDPNQLQKFESEMSEIFKKLINKKVVVVQWCG